MKNKKKYIIIAIIILICAIGGMYILYEKSYNRGVDDMVNAQERLNEFSDIINSEKITGIKIIRLLQIIESGKMMEMDIAKLEIDGKEYEKIDKEVINTINEKEQYTIKVGHVDNNGELKLNIYIWKES